MATDGSTTEQGATPPPAQEKKGFLGFGRKKTSAPPAERQIIAPDQHASTGIAEIRSELKTTAQKTEGDKDRDITTELMPKIQEILSKEGPVDEAAILKIMDELEKSGELKDHVHTVGEGKDRSIFLTTPVNKTGEQTSYGVAASPRESVPIGTLATKQSEWLVINRKGFLKTIIIDEQTLNVDESSAFFDYRRNPDGRDAVTGELRGGDRKYYADRTRKWADEVQKSVKYYFGERNHDTLAQVLALKDYPPVPVKFHHDLYGSNASQEEIIKVDAEEHLYYFGQKFNPNSPWHELHQSEDEVKASEAISPRYDNRVGWRMHQDPIFQRITSPDFVQSAIKTNAKPPTAQ